MAHNAGQTQHISSRGERSTRTLSTSSGLSELQVQAAQRSHREIGADRWCVNRRDLRQLRAEVAEAIQDGRIVPTEKDPFDPKDRTIGPSIYTVNDQYIKPITLDAGGQSWALMQHPEGLPCEVFVTHAWQEGVFEFIDKVLCSLPWRADNVWCCFLANPQNLDIGDMIRSPPDSPFAKALRAAPRLLVVPNEKASVYSRLWCAYEAFLAHEWDKVIQTARPPVYREMLQELPLLFGAMLAGALVCLFRNDALFTCIYWFSAIFQFPLFLAAMSAKRPRTKQIINLFGIALGSCALWIAEYAFDHGALDVVGIPQEDLLKPMVRWWPRISKASEAAMTITFFVVAEVDRVRFALARRQSQQLVSGSTGTVQDSCCSNAEDEQNLRKEISHRIPEVDETIRVLTMAGMSTSNLRCARKLGVNMSGAGFIEYAFIVILVWQGMLHWWTLDLQWDDYASYMWEERLCFYMNALNKLTALGFLWLLWCQSSDARVFSSRVAQKFGILIAVAPVTAVAIMRFSHTITEKNANLVLCVTMLMVWFFVLPIAASGIHRIARLPYCGPRFASMLAAVFWEEGSSISPVASGIP